MSDAEGLMWRLEKDPYLSSTFANVTDPRPATRHRPSAAADGARHVRRRPTAPAGAAGSGQPVLRRCGWTTPTSTSRYHVRHIALPKPGTMRQLLDLASLIAADPFDRTRPLWQFVIVDGLRGGKSALIEKLHHTIADGEAGVSCRCSSSTSSATPRNRRRSSRSRCRPRRRRRSSRAPTCCATCSPVGCGSRSACSARSRSCSPTRPASPTPATPRPTPSAA